MEIQNNHQAKEARNGTIYVTFRQCKSTKGWCVIALVPEFISILRDIRDKKYPQIVELRDETDILHSQTETLYELTLSLKTQTEEIRDATRGYYNNTVNYGESLKIDVDAIKDSTQVIYNDTLLVKQSILASEQNVENMEQNVEEMVVLIEAMSGGVGFTINEVDGHMYVEVPSGSNVDSLYIDANGHMIATIIVT